MERRLNELSEIFGHASDSLSQTMDNISTEIDQLGKAGIFGVKAG